MAAKHAVSVGSALPGQRQGTRPAPLALKCSPQSSMHGQGGEPPKPVPPVHSGPVHAADTGSVTPAHAAASTAPPHRRSSAAKVPISKSVHLRGAWRHAALADTGHDQPREPTTATGRPEAHGRSQCDKTISSAQYRASRRRELELKQVALRSELGRLQMQAEPEPDDAELARAQSIPLAPQAASRASIERLQFRRHRRPTQLVVDSPSREASPPCTAPSDPWQQQQQQTQPAILNRPTHFLKQQAGRGNAPRQLEQLPPRGKSDETQSRMVVSGQAFHLAADGTLSI